MKPKTTLFLALAFTSFATASEQSHWVVTWGASSSPQLATEAEMRTAKLQFENQTLREIVHTSIGGSMVRVRLSNAYGKQTAEIGAAHIALRAKGSGIAAGSDRALTFSGRPAAMIPAGALVVSDPVDLDVARLGDLAVSVFVPEETGLPTMHNVGLHTTYVSKPGDFTGQASIPDAATTRTWYWLASVDVLAPPDAATIVAFGDSITDGTSSTPDTNSSYPAFLAQRIAKNMPSANIAVVNQGIAGNRLLRDAIGTNALARFDRDVLSQNGVKWMILLEGINDIGRATGTNVPADGSTISAEEEIAAYRQIIERAHTHGIKIMGATLTPYEGAAYYSEAGEKIREAVNQWIRTSGAFDQVVDFEAAVRDPDHPKQIRPGFNIMDHLHPNDAGYKAMAEAIDLSFFADKAKLSSARKK